MNIQKTAFTLVELLITIVIIGILAGIGVSQFGQHIQKAKFIKGVHFESVLRRKMLTSLNSYVAFWTFNETSASTLRDGSGQGNHLTLPPSVSRANIERKYASDKASLLFNGTGEGIKIGGNTLLPKNKITISLWFNLNSHKSFNQLFRYVDSRILLRVAKNQKLCFSMTTNDGQKRICHNGIELNKWYHVGAVYNGQEMILYINGNEVGKNPHPNQELNPSNRTDMWIAVGDNVAASVLDGYLDNVYVWGDAFEWD